MHTYVYVSAVHIYSHEKKYIKNFKLMLVNKLNPYRLKNILCFFHRHLTKREQRILHRRKQVESLLQWQMKLDSEEMAVRELEQKALDLVDHSKKRTKYYISSSASANHDGIIVF